MTPKIGTILVISVLVIAGCSAKPPSPDLRCASLPAQVLAAQSVPDAEYVPCIKDILPPWSLMSTDSDQDRTQVVMEWSSSGSATERALVSLKATCPSDGVPEPPRTDLPPGVSVTEAVVGRTVTTVYAFEGGCVQVDVKRARQHEVAPLTTDDFTIEFVPREVLNAYVLEQTNDQVELDPVEGS